MSITQNHSIEISEFSKQWFKLMYDLRMQSICKFNI